LAWVGRSPRGQIGPSGPLFCSKTAFHADKVVYSEGLSLDGAAVPVGVSCRICERPDCHQRALPPLGRKLTVRTNERRIVPFSIE